MKFSYQTGAHGSYSHYELSSSKRQAIRYRWVAAVFGMSLIAVTTLVLYGSLRKYGPVRAVTPVTAPTVTQPIPAVQPESNYQTVPKDFTADLQNWLKKRPGKYGVFVGTATGDVYADVQADGVFSSESIYKLYVAYLGYQQLDTGTVRADQAYSAGRTRAECLTLMIRTSDSPCAEKMLQELGKPTVNAKLQAYGLTNTSVSSFRTTARDAAKVLTLIQNGTDLSPNSRQALLDSLKSQQYRNGLPKGFVGSTVFNKVGFRDLVQYNDVGIVVLADGRIAIVSVMSENAGVRNIARLGTEINRLLQ